MEGRVFAMAFALQEKTDFRCNVVELSIVAYVTAAETSQGRPGLRPTTLNTSRLTVCRQPMAALVSTGYIQHADGRA